MKQSAAAKSKTETGRRGRTTTRRRSGQDRREFAPLAGAISAVAEPHQDNLTGIEVDPGAEEAFWREHFYTRGYVKPGDSWSQFGPAFRLGWDARRRDPDRTWSQIEGDLRRTWACSQGEDRLAWRRARLAARDAWDHAATWFDDRDEEAYWSAILARREGSGFDNLRAAYRFGWEAKRRHGSRSWQAAEDDLRSEWHQRGLDSKLAWDQAVRAVRAAWQRVAAAQPTGSYGDQADR